jgi:F1F0 ATPase subunit 2
MDQDEFLRWLLAMMIGITCGLIFFGGLLWTVRKAVTAKSPALLLLLSFLARMAITLTGFYLASYSHWPGMLICLAGFLGARVFVTRVSRDTGAKK